MHFPTPRPCSSLRRPWRLLSLLHYQDWSGAAQVRSLPPALAAPAAVPACERGGSVSGCCLVCQSPTRVCTATEAPIVLALRRMRPHPCVCPTNRALVLAARLLDHFPRSTIFQLFLGRFEPLSVPAAASYAARAHTYARAHAHARAHARARARHAHAHATHATVPVACTDACAPAINPKQKPEPNLETPHSTGNMCGHICAGGGRASSRRPRAYGSCMPADGLGKRFRV